MTWSISLASATVGQAHAYLLENNAPDPIKKYVIAGISGLAARHGDDVLVDVMAHGHLCEHGDDGEESSARIGVRKAEAKEVDDPEAKANAADADAADAEAERLRLDQAEKDRVAAEAIAKADRDRVAAAEQAERDRLAAEAAANAKSGQKDDGKTETQPPVS